MPIARIGYGTDFILKNQGVGVATDTTDVKLEVGGTTKANYNITGIASLTNYAGFAAAEQSIDGTVTLTGEHSTLGDIVVGLGSTAIISTGATVCTGTVESISLTDHFSPPCGYVDDRPECPVEGTVRFNKDLNTLEFYNGVEWRQFTVNGASGRGVLGPSPSPAGGGAPTANLSTFSMISGGNNTYWGNLSVGAYAQNSACSSATRIIFGGGTPYASPWPVTDAMDYKAMASDGNTQDFGNLTDERRALTAFSSSTRGIFVGGVEPSSVNVIDYVEISTVGNALDFGDCMTAGRYSQSGCASPTRGLCVHGNPNNRDYIEVLTIASKGNTIKFGNRMFQGGYTTGVCNGVRALFGGGYQMNPLSGPSRTEITTVIMASDGNETKFGDLTAGRYYAIGLSSQTRAVFLGGTTNSQVVDSVLYESGGAAVNFGELDRKRWSTNGSTDCHGGLGGY
tara:strand:+ start:615 stop:1976 length:1362 start_codon:yes stop_codon:yes gene_type:complete